MKKVEKHCRRCGQRLWVPAALGDLRLTCPKCKYCWDEFGATLEGLNPESAESKGDLTEVRCHDCGCLIYKNELVRRDVRVGSSYFRMATRNIKVTHLITGELASVSFAMMRGLQPKLQPNLITLFAGLLL